MTDETRDQQPADSGNSERPLRASESYRGKAYDQVETAPPVLAQPDQARPAGNAPIVAESSVTPAVAASPPAEE